LLRTVDLVISNLVENITSMIESKVHQSLNTLQAPAVVKQEYTSFLNQCKSFLWP